MELRPCRYSPIDDLRCAYYLQPVRGGPPGRIAAISGVLGRHSVSVRSMEQDAPEPEAGIPVRSRRRAGQRARRTLSSSPILPMSGTCKPACTSCAMLDVVRRIGGLVRVVGS